MPGHQSTGSVLRHVVVKNGYQGIVVDEANDVTLEECIIDNCYDAGLIGSRAGIRAVNCLISNCGKNVMLLGGGNYEFTHCTNVAISNNFIQHKDPALIITDFIKEGDNIITSPLNVSFTNSIIWGAFGSVENEVVTAREGNETFDVTFTNCLWKINDQPKNVTANAVIENEDPLFVNIEPEEYDFQLMEGSPAVGTGLNAGITNDLKGGERKVSNPDLGSYETSF